MPEYPQRSIFMLKHMFNKNKYAKKGSKRVYLTPKVGLTEMLERLKGFLYEVNNRRQKEDNRNLHD